MGTERPNVGVSAEGCVARVAPDDCVDEADGAVVPDDCVDETDDAVATFAGSSLTTC